MFKHSGFWRRFRRRWLYALLSVVIAFAIALGTPQPSYSQSWLELLLRGVQIVQLSSMSNSQEVDLGKQINQQLLRGGEVKLYRNEQLNRYLNRVGQRIAQKSDRPDIPYTFQIVDDKSINAFATMGGFVYLHKGLIAKADNEAELASVVAHEIGHIAGRHAVEQMRERAISQGLLSAAGLDRSTAVQIGVDLAVNLPNSRGDEFEADQLGLANLKRANYAPAAMISFMQKLLAQGGSVPSFLSTHPATSERIEVLKSQIEPKTANVGSGLDNQAYRRQIQPLL